MSIVVSNNNNNHKARGGGGGAKRPSPKQMWDAGTRAGLFQCDRCGRIMVEKKSYARHYATVTCQTRARQQQQVPRHELKLDPQPEPSPEPVQDRETVEALAALAASTSALEQLKTECAQLQ